MTSHDNKNTFRDLFIKTPHPYQPTLHRFELCKPHYVDLLTKPTNRKVYWIICDDAVSGSDGWAWIRKVKYKDGCLAMLKLNEHYDRVGLKTRHIQDVEEHLKSCHYKSEMMFSFKKYVMAIKEYFDTLKEDNIQRIWKESDDDCSKI